MAGRGGCDYLRYNVTVPAGLSRTALTVWKHKGCWSKPHWRSQFSWACNFSERISNRLSPPITTYTLKNFRKPNPDKRKFTYRWFVISSTIYLRFLFTSQDFKISFLYSSFPICSFSKNISLFLNTMITATAVTTIVSTHFVTGVMAIFSCMVFTNRWKMTHASILRSFFT